MIQLTPQTEAVRSEDAPVAPRDNTLPDLSDDRGWSFDISSLKVADSVLVFQHEDDEQVTIRNIRLQMEQDPQHRGSFEFSGGLIAISAISHYPLTVRWMLLIIRMI